ncbi:hypothetical protein Syun_003137 [Stephania yunnanensis]|uniref:DYW domain-containing protein n=1 Tax=Stephania yunnanensis TaxID=152371 RepID=A0AAP0Q0D4_9MAGN
MRAITGVVSVSRYFSTSKHLQILNFSGTKAELVELEEEEEEEKNLYFRALDGYPDLFTLKRLHSEIVSNRSLKSNPCLVIKLMRAFAALGDADTTRHMFDEFPRKNIIFYNVMIRSYVNNNMYYNALVLYASMLGSGIRPDNYTFPCVLKACSGCENLRVGLQIHAAALRVGLDANLFVGNGLISMYGKCDLLCDARRVLDGMHRKDVVSWNSMLAVFARNGRFDEGLEVCREMELLSFKPDEGTLASLSPAITNTSAANVAFVSEMFNKMPKKSLISSNVMIAVYVNNSMPDKALELFSQMETNGIEPDAVTLASVLPACGDLSALTLGRQIHEYVVRKKLCPNLILENALVDMYAKCGCLRAAREVFDAMKSHDVVSWTSMISAYGMNGHGRDAMALFRKMVDSGLIPDQIAFISILSACSHSGLLEEGRYYFRLMVEELRIPPKVEHFACMVDILGRSGCVDEAYNFIKEMPLEPNERVWGALLGACRIYSNMSLGLIAADHLFGLVPTQSGYYVLLSNIYAKAGRWEEVTAVRSIMKSKGIKKLPGCSNVELGDRVHTFLVGDRSHPQSNEIYAELDVLVSKMKEDGYVPEMDSALHDVEDEDKENHLAIHNEKLAIAFVIINTKPGTTIRITKNLRVCGDCHIAAKHISKIAKREIIIRDTNRFHHFKGGLCSCGDYW